MNNYEENPQEKVLLTGIMQMHALDVLALEFDGDDFAIRVYQSDFSHTIIGSHIAAPFPPHLAGSRAAAAVRGYEPSPPH